MKNIYKVKLAKACKELLNYDLVKGTWGNLSILDENLIYITPSGYDYKKMTSEDICVIDIDGKQISGKRKVSSEWILHSEIYKNRKDIKFILHTHPQYSSLASVCLEKVPSLIEDTAMICGENVYIAKYGDPGSKQLAENAVKYLKNNHAVILRNHGLVTIGETFNEALSAALICEKNIFIYTESKKISDTIFEIPEKKLKELRQKYLEYYRQK
jgi:L-fuculose-phosphate aldolase